jgi:NHLM bacteriocin system ABC transporter ATP-binding protein
MGWFDEQIKQRKQHDNDVFEDSFINIAGAVLGQKISAALNDDRQITKDAIDEILKFYHIRTREVPEHIRDMNEQLEYLLRPNGIMRRTVNLSDGWYQDAIGAMLAVKKDDHSVTALIPSGFSGYTYLDTASGKRVKITKANQGLFEEEAIAFYKPFPLKKMGMKDLLVYMAQTLSTADYVTMLAATLIVTLVGMLLPRLNNILFSTVVASGSRQLLLAIGTFMVCVTISSALLTAMKTLIASRFSTKMGITIEAATMMRILSLPADFFKQYSSGELYARSQYVNILCEQMVTIVMTTGLTSIFSLLYISQIFLYAPALVVPALMVILVTVVFSVVSAFVQMNVSQKQMELATKETGLSYALISGVQKVKLTGAEKRAFAKWGNAYAEQAKYLYNPPLFLKINSALSTAISLVGTLVIYYSAVKSGVSVADYYAFNTAYAVVSGAFLTLAGITTSLAQIKPIMKMIQPILETVPEVSEGKQMVTRLSGAIELNNVSFRYSENMPLVLDNLSLKIRPGQYVAIVGRTGCGKSTLMRLLTGFETPQKGAIYYDGKDLNSLDLKSLRKHIGVVMQNGKLFQGDIYSNIVISAPQLTLDDAWKAAEMAGIADDIRQMPMGMFTLISEGSGGISGGQRQRLMIARAIAPNPKILMFDEATSALDNISQKVVSESLDHLKCTRIVIAHRLSTIQQCDRIIVLDKGKIIEDGTYEDLIAQNGFFAELVARQRLDA